MYALPAAIVATLLCENVRALPLQQLGPVRSSMFLGIEKLPAFLEAHVGQQPAQVPSPITDKKANKSQDDSRKTSFGKIWVVCTLLGSVGSLVGCMGFGLIIWQFLTRKYSESLMGESIPTSLATISDRKHYTTSYRDVDDGPQTRDHYEVSYWFDAVDNDGMRCRVTVVDREIGGINKKLWEECQSGSHHSVSYCPDEPRHCRLTKQEPEHHEFSHGIISCCSNFAGVAFVVAGFFLGVVLMTNVNGIKGFIVSGSVWLGLVSYCICCVVTPKIKQEFEPKIDGASIKMLGVQVPSSDSQGAGASGESREATPPEAATTISASGADCGGASEGGRVPLAELVLAQKRRREELLARGIK